MHNSLIRSNEGLTLGTSAFEPLYGGQFTCIINPDDKTKLSRYTFHRRSTTVSLETYPSIQKHQGPVVQNPD